MGFFTGEKKNSLADFKFCDSKCLGCLFHKIRHARPSFNGIIIFVNLDCVVRDLICMLCDSEIMISAVCSTSDQRLKSHVRTG